MNPASDIQNHMIGLVDPLQNGSSDVRTLLSDRALSAGDFLDRVARDKAGYEKAAKAAGVDLTRAEAALAPLLEAAKAAPAKKKVAAKKAAQKVDED